MRKLNHIIVAMAFSGLIAGCSRQKIVIYEIDPPGEYCGSYKVKIGMPGMTIVSSYPFQLIITDYKFFYGYNLTAGDYDFGHPDCGGSGNYNLTQNITMMPDSVTQNTGCDSLLVLRGEYTLVRTADSLFLTRRDSTNNIDYELRLSKCR
ncbi:hypothetical protein TRIP_C20870 [Candidatus Zixiibacteriota bacterium]|nr:hypothetical protein TRIP_C20870 [candidate division Zixibacteria bacterium]